MIDPFEEVTTRKLENDYSDGARVLEFFRFMEESDKPLFAHIHLMGTHGSRFLPLRRIFSSGKEQDKPWMVDFYDDAILEFDKGVEVIIRYLKRNNQLKNTVVVIHTDHGMRWKTNVRIPFIVYFPDESHAGRVSTNAQHIDIAPTILDYLGIEIPDWMVGESLLSPGIDKLRPIIGVSVSGIIKRENLLQEKTDLSPPFYGLGFVSVTVCHKFYGLNLKDKTFLVSDIKGHTAPCEASELPSQAEARDYIVNHLRENGYDVSSII